MCGLDSFTTCCQTIGGEAVYVSPLLTPDVAVPNEVLRLVPVVERPALRLVPHRVPGHTGLGATGQILNACLLEGSLLLSLGPVAPGQCGTNPVQWSQLYISSSNSR